MLFKTMGFFDMRKKWGCWKMLGWNQHLNQKKKSNEDFQRGGGDGSSNGRPSLAKRCATTGLLSTSAGSSEGDG